MEAGLIEEAMRKEVVVSFNQGWKGERDVEMEIRD